MRILDIARTVYEINWIYCNALGISGPTWDEAPSEIIKGTIEAVENIIENPTETTEMIHEKWLDKKVIDGWKWGPILDFKNKTDPMIMRYEKLSFHKRTQDILFRTVVLGLAEIDPKESQ